MAQMIIRPRVREITATTGTGDYMLAGAPTGFVAWSVIAAGNYAPYYAADGVNWEEGFATYQAGPARLVRAVLRSSNGDALVNWGAGNKTIRLAPSSVIDHPRLVTKSVAGTGDITLTPAEQRCAVLVLTGALTGNRNVIVDETIWPWIVYNNTSGSFALTVKTSGAAGITVAQGRRTVLACDGVAVVTAADFLPLAGGTMTGDLLFTDNSFDVGKNSATRPRDGFFSRNVVVGNILAVSGIYEAGGLIRTAGAITGNSAISNGASNLGDVEVRSNGTGAAMMSFHRPGAFAAYFGLDIDNTWKVGGWSTGAVAYPVLHSGNMNIWKGFQSSDQVITAGAALTLAHGLPARPKLVSLQLVCVTGEHGFAAGDVIDASPFHSQGGNSGVVAWADATNINVRFGSHATIHFLTHTANTGASVNLTDANWRLRFQAWG